MKCNTNEKTDFLVSPFENCHIDKQIRTHRLRCFFSARNFEDDNNGTKMLQK